ncbi:MAG: hypothetical protein KDA80_22840, partial [Planctomycetaceae bacterium]|nr:hypothetical protein [Planctomycetaceae bacterium]
MPATQSPSQSSSQSGNFVEFDEFLEIQLAKARTGIHRTDLISSVVILLAVFCAYVLVFTIFDHWIIAGGFSDGARLLLFTGIATFTVGWSVWKIVLPGLKTVNAMYAAREIEQAHPELQTGLLSWVDFRQRGKKVSSRVSTVLEKRTAHQIERTNVDDAIDRRLLMNSSYVLMGLVIAVCLYMLISPKSMSASIWRAILPASSVSVATKTQILEVEPGDAEVLARDQLEVSVELGGEIPEEVKLFFTTKDRRFVDEPVVMRKDGEAPAKFRGRLTGEAGRGLMKDLAYYIVAGDAKSPNYQVRVNQPPSADVIEVQYDYPEYMGLESATQPGSTIEAWEGTQVTVRAVPNMPVKKAVLYCTDLDTATETAEAYDMSITDAGVEASWTLHFDDEGMYAKHYFVQVWNERDQRDPTPTLHRIRIRPDLPPEVTVIHPTEDLEAPANANVPVAYDAQDPDFLLRQLQMHLELNGEALPVVPTLFAGPPDRKEVRGTHAIQLKDLPLKPGDQLTFFLEAQDNLEPFGKRGRNITRTSKRMITIVEPKTDEEAAKFEQQQEQAAEQKLQDANPDQGAGGQRQPEGEQRQPDQAPPEGQREQPIPNPEQAGGTSDEQQLGEGDPSQNQPAQNDPGMRRDRQPEGDNPPSQDQPMDEQRPEDQPSDQLTDSGQEGEPQEGSQQQQGKPSKSQNRQPSGQPQNNSERNPTQQGQQSNSQQTDPSGTREGNPGQRQAGGQQPPQENTDPRQDKAADDEALRELLKWHNEQKDKGESQESDAQQPNPQEQNGQRDAQPGDPSAQDQNQQQQPRDSAGNMGETAPQTGEKNNGTNNAARRPTDPRNIGGENPPEAGEQRPDQQRPNGQPGADPEQRKPGDPQMVGDDPMKPGEGSSSTAKPPENPGDSPMPNSPQADGQPSTMPDADSPAGAPNGNPPMPGDPNAPGTPSTPEAPMSPMNGANPNTSSQPEPADPSQNSGGPQPNRPSEEMPSEKGPEAAGRDKNSPAGPSQDPSMPESGQDSSKPQNGQDSPMPQNGQSGEAPKNSEQPMNGAGSPKPDAPKDPMPQAGEGTPGEPMPMDNMNESTPGAKPGEMGKGAQQAPADKGNESGTRQSPMNSGQPKPGDPMDSPQNGQPQNGQPQNGQPQNGQPQNGQPQNGQPQNGQPGEMPPSEGQPQPGQPMPNEQMPGDPMPGQQGQGQQGQGQQGQGQQGQGQQGQGQQGQGQQGQGQQGQGQQGQGQQGQ